MVFLSSPSPSLMRPGEVLNSQVALAYVATLGDPSNDGEAPEVVLSAVRCCIEEEILADRSADLEDLLSTNAGVQTTASLRRQVELFMESAFQGKIELHAAPFLRIAQHLVRQIPGFVVGSVIRTHFANSAQTREALQGTLRLLQTEGVPATYDACKGIVMVTEVLTRLTTFEYLHGALSDVKSEQQAGEQPISSPERSAVELLAEKKSRRCSLASCHPSRAVPDADAAQFNARRRRSLPSSREAQALQEQDGAGPGMLHLLLRLDNGPLEGSSFCAAWQQFRRACLPQVCMDLVAMGCLSQGFGLLARHGGEFPQEEVITIVEALPIDVGEEHEEGLPFWIAHRAMSLLTCRSRLVRWLIARAELLEYRHENPNAALQLLGTVIATAMPGMAQHLGSGTAASAMVPSLQQLVAAAREGVHCLPEARIVRSAFWSGSMVPLSRTCAWANTVQGNQTFEHALWQNTAILVVSNGMALQVLISSKFLSVLTCLLFVLFVLICV
jgi:hypothetical protein